MVPDQQIRETLESTPDPQEASTKLVGMANEAGGMDNITVVILDFEEGEGVEVLAPDSGLKETDTGVTRQMRTYEPAAEGAPAGAPPAPAPPAATRPPDQGGFTAVVSAPPRRADDTILATAPEAPSAQVPQFEAPPERGRRRGRRRRVAVWIVAVVIVLALAAVGLRLFLDSRWFVGARDGHVAVFRGIPTQLFGTVNMFGLVKEFPTISARKAEGLAPFRDLSDGHTAGSEDDAFRIVDTIRKQLAEQRRSGAPSP